MQTFEQLLKRAEELFLAEVKANPAPGVECSIDWKAPPFCDAFDLALQGKVIELEDNLWSSFDLHEESRLWESERIEEVERQLADEIDLNLDIDIDDIIDKLRNQIQAGDIESDGCYPEIEDGADCTVTLNFYEGDEADVSGLFLLFRVLGIHFSQLADIMHLNLDNFRDHMEAHMLPEDFSDHLEVLPQHNLEFLWESSAGSNNIGLILPLNWGELKKISSIVEAGGRFELQIKNPAVFSYDGDASGDYSSADIVIKDALNPKSITLTSELLNTLDRYMKPIDQKVERNLFSQMTLKVIETSHENKDLAERNPITNTMRFKREMLMAILSGRTDLVDDTINQYEPLLPQFKPFLIQEMVGGWTFMHVAAIMKDPEDRITMMRKLHQEGVNAKIQGDGLDLTPLDLFMEHGWIDSRENELEPDAINVETMEFIVEIGATKTMGEELRDVLSGSNLQTLIAIENSHQLPVGTIKSRKNSMKL